jgi:hypothetical protein
MPDSPAAGFSPAAGRTSGRAPDDPLARVAALDGIVEAVEAARRAVDKVLAHRVLRRGSAQVTAESTLRSARASAALEGADVPMDDLRARLSAALPGADPPSAAALVDLADLPDAADLPDLALVMGAVRLNAGLGSLRSAWERAPRQALARMHVLAARGLVEDSSLGRPRTVGDGPAARLAGGLAPDADVADPLGLGPAPSPAEAAVRLDGLADLLISPTSAPAIVVAAVAHGELLALRPFGTADGLVARAAGRLVLVARGLDPKSITAVELGYVEAGGYADAARDYLSGTAAGLASWVAYCARAVELGARDSLAVCEALQRAG